MKVVVAAYTLFVLTLLGGTAMAGEYEVQSCRSGHGNGAFNLAGPAPRGVIVTSSCPPSAAGLSLATGNYDSFNGDKAAWVVAASPGTRIRRLEVQRSLGKRTNAWEAAVRVDGAVVETCIVPPTDYRCSVGTAPGTQAKIYDGLDADRVEFGLECKIGTSDPCIGGRSPSVAWITVSSATTLVYDPAAPAIVPGGSLLQQGGWQRGVGTVAISASDASGVKSLGVTAGGLTVGSAGGNCDYSRMQPCPPSLSGTYDLDTSRLGDGTHEVRVTATDAADQAATQTATLRVDRNAPAAPAELFVERNPDRTLSLQWKNPDQGSAAPIAAARYEVCSALGVGCVGGPLTSGQGLSRIESVVIPDGDHLVKVWLQDEAGNADPTTAATLTVDPSKITARTVNTNPPVFEAPSARLKITRARRSGSMLTISGTIARAASARIEAQVSRSKTGRPVVAKARVKPKRGKWTARVRLPASLRSSRTMYLAVKYAGQNAYRSTTLRRTLSEKAPRAGRATDEFSVKPSSGRR